MGGLPVSPGFPGSQRSLPERAATLRTSSGHLSDGDHWARTDVRQSCAVLSTRRSVRRSPRFRERSRARARWCKHGPHLHDPRKAATAVRQRFWEEGAIPEDAHSTVDISEGSGAEAIGRMLAILGQLPEDPGAVAAFARASRTLVEWWNAGDDREHPRDRNFEAESVLSELLQRFVMRTTSVSALEVLRPVLDAIGRARHRVSFETYIYQSGAVADRFTAAFEAAARRGVDVRIVLDSIGAKEIDADHVRRLERAGCRVVWFNEVGGYSMTVGDRRAYAIQVAEKGIIWTRLRATGTPSHGSMPSPDNAAAKLATAVTRLNAAPRPPRVIPVVRRFFEGLGLGEVAQLAERGAEAEATARLEASVADETLRRSLNAMLRDTVTPNVIHVGKKVNVVPGSGEAEVPDPGPDSGADAAGRHQPDQSPDLLGEFIQLPKFTRPNSRG